MPPSTDNSSLPPTTTAIPPVPSARMKANLLLLEPGEEMITVIYRHPIGIIAIYLEAFAAIAALIILAIVLAPDMFSNLQTSSYLWLIGGLVFGISLLFLILFIATYVYRQNRLIVTNKTLVEVSQPTLFIRKISRLSLTNVEDVSADQRGILASLFNFGTLMVQTAGAIDNFIFKFCPDPNTYARRILEAREAYAQGLDSAKRRFDTAPPVAASPASNDT